jgi:hypothetical protein
MLTTNNQLDLTPLVTGSGLKRRALSGRTKRSERSGPAMNQFKLFLASGLWGVSIVFSLLEDVTMALGNRIVGINQGDIDETI